MGRNRKRDREWQNTLKDISESSWANVEHNRQIGEKLDDLNEISRATAENAVQTNEQLKAIKSDTEKSSKSKIPLYSLIVAVITLVVAISGLSVAGIYEKWKAEAETKPVFNEEAEATPEMEVEAEPEPETKVETEGETAAEDSEHTIYLYSEYNPVELYVETEMTATLNFEANTVNITAYLASGEESSLPLKRKNAAEWQTKVQFTEVGVHKVVATAETSDGETIENSIEVEVIPINIDIDADMIDMDTINQFLPTEMWGGN